MKDAMFDAARAAVFALKKRLARVNEMPVFVLGNQKSGTTAIAALLAEYAGLTATLDVDYPAAHALIRVQRGAQSFEAFVKTHRWAFSRDVVKEPHLTFLYGPLRRRFPRARYAMVIRDPRDNVRSILNRLDIPGDREAITLEAYEKAIPIWQEIVRSTSIGVKEAQYVAALAARWNRATDVYLTHTEQIELIRYEDFLAGKEAAIARLAWRLGLPQAGSIAEKVDVQYQPRGDRSVAWVDFFGARNLARIEDACRKRMQKLGYAS